MLRSLASVAPATLTLAVAVVLRRAGRRRLGALGLVLAALTFGFGLQEGTLDCGVAMTLGLQDVTFLLWVLLLATIALRRIPTDGPRGRAPERGLGLTPGSPGAEPAAQHGENSEEPKKRS
jgi:hypothetical protein